MTDFSGRRWTREELTYCSNVHPGETLNQIGRVVTEQLAAVRRARGLSSMGTGLWLSAAGADELIRDDDARKNFGDLLAGSGIDLFTINGFPYGDFHSPSVKEKVYAPDWADQRRYGYTLKLARILAELLSDTQPFGSISTLPLGSAANWDDVRQATAVDALCRLAVELDELYRQTGRRIVICLEMEPGCVLERTEQVVDLFTEELPAAAARRAIEPQLVRRHIGVCFDVCHQAVMFENPVDALRRIHDARIAVGKIQLSSALEVTDPDSKEALAELAEYVEPRYLHQVQARTADDQIVATLDLPEALNTPVLPRNAVWRVHFHVPIQAGRLSAEHLRTTRPALEGIFDLLAELPDFCPHLEVETYTWQVLPEALRPRDDEELCRGIVRELEWVEFQMQRCDLLKPEHT
jgi:sugar phosphate isomerase/epimerase